MTYNITSRILPNAQLPYNVVKNTFEKRNKIAGQKSLEFYKEISKECKDGVYSIPRIKKCIDKIFAPHKLNYIIKKESKESYSGRFGNIITTDKNNSELVYKGFVFNLPIKKGTDEIENKYTLLHEFRHMADYLYNPKIKMHRINNLIGNEEYAQYTDYLKFKFLDTLPEETTMEDFKNKANEIINLLPRKIAIDCLQKIRNDIFTETNAYKNEIRFLFKDAKGYNDFQKGINLDACYEYGFQFEEKLKFANAKLKELIQQERASLKEQFG